MRSTFAACRHGACRGELNSGQAATLLELPGLLRILLDAPQPQRFTWTSIRLARTQIRKTTLPIAPPLSPGCGAPGADPDLG